MDILQSHYLKIVVSWENMKIRKTELRFKITLYLHGRPDHCVYNDLDSCDKLQEERREEIGGIHQSSAQLPLFTKLTGSDWPSNHLMLPGTANMLAISPPWAR